MGQLMRGTGIETMRLKRNRYVYGLRERENYKVKEESTWFQRNRKARG